MTDNEKIKTNGDDILKLGSAPLNANKREGPVSQNILLRGGRASVEVQRN